MPLSEERIKVLEMIDEGIIDAEEGYRLLQAMEGTEEAESSLGGEIATESAPRENVDSDAPVEAPTPEEIKKWKRWWVIPLWIGAGMTTLGGGLMYWSWRASGFGFWFACSWLPFLLGAMLLALAWSSHYSPWLHVRIRQKPGEKPEKIAFSFPLPTRLTAWGLRTFGHLIPQFDATGLDEVVYALGDSSEQDTPLIVDVSDSEDGERVQVFIG